jgi:hypothetical protein
MLQAMLLAGIVAAPLGSAALFLPMRRHARRAGIWSAIRRSVFAVIGTVVLAAAVTVILRLLGASRYNLVAGVAAVVFASLIWMPVTRRSNRGRRRPRILDAGPRRSSQHVGGDPGPGTASPPARPSRPIPFDQVLQESR